MPKLDEYLTGNKPEKKPYTWRELKEFCNNLHYDWLDEKVVITTDDNIATFLTGADRSKHDYYVNKTDAEDVGALDDLKALHGDDFLPENYVISTPEGSPFLY